MSIVVEFENKEFKIGFEIPCNDYKSIDNVIQSTIEREAPILNRLNSYIVNIYVNNIKTWTCYNPKDLRTTPNDWRSEGLLM